MNTIANLFQKATQAHQAKQWEQAADYYRQVLAQEPNHADSLHLLGVVRGEQKQWPEALALMGQAIAALPQNTVFYCNRAQIFRRMQNWEAAVQEYHRALSFAPRKDEIYTALAETHLLANQPQAAILQYLYACYLNPHQPVTTHHQLGNAFLARGFLDAAKLAYERALTLNSQSAETLSNLGVICAEQRQFDQAAAYQRQALSINPQFGDAYINFGLVLSQQHAFAEAESAYQKALTLKPDQQSSIHSNRGLNYQAQGEWPAAQDCFNQALQLDAANAKAQFNRATLSLLLGDFKQGWADYEIRFALNDPNHPQLLTAQPRWQGEDLHGKTLLVHYEQGLGDTLQFVRYLPLLKERGANITLQTQADLIPLLTTQSQLGIKELITPTQSLPAHDYFVPLMSLPYCFKTLPETIPAAKNAYLQAPVNSAVKLASSPNLLRVGLVWAGNAQHHNDHQRSILLNTLRPLLKESNVHFYSLQYGLMQAEIQHENLSSRLEDLSPQLNTWADTAQIINQLDLVITVDTAVAHLSAALGKPTWILLPWLPDFRWMLDRSDSPWYGSARLFRQPTRGDWDSVIQTVSTALHNLALPLAKASKNSVH